MSQPASTATPWHIKPWDLDLSAGQAEHIRRLGGQLQHAIDTRPCAGWRVWRRACCPCKRGLSMSPTWHGART